MTAIERRKRKVKRERERERGFHFTIVITGEKSRSSVPAFVPRKLPRVIFNDRQYKVQRVSSCRRTSRVRAWKTEKDGEPAYAGSPGLPERMGDVLEKSFPGKFGAPKRFPCELHPARTKFKARLPLAGRQRSAEDNGRTRWFSSASRKLKRRAVRVSNYFHLDRTSRRTVCEVSSVHERRIDAVCSFGNTFGPPGHQGTFA